MGITSIALIYVARYLGPEKYGLLLYAVSFVALFKVFSKMGLNEIVVRELVNDERNKNTLLGTSFIIQLCGVLVMWMLIAIVVPFTKNDAYCNLLVAIIAGGMIFSVFSNIDFYFQAKVLSKYSVIARSITGFVIPVSKIVLVFTHTELIWFAVVILAEHLLRAFLYIIVYKYQKLSILKWRFDLQIAKRLLQDSWPLIFTGLLITVYMKIDQVMLKNMLDAEQVGIYAVAVRLSEFGYFIPMLVCQSIFPAIIKAKKFGKDHYNNRLQQLYDLMTFLSLSLAIVMTFSSNIIIDFLFGSEYTESGKVLAIHIWAGVMVFYGTARSKWIIAENLQKKAISIHLCGAILNVVLNIFFIPAYGVNGAALATLLSYSLTTLITGIAIKEFRPQLIMYLKSFVHYITLRPLIIGYKKLSNSRKNQ